MSVNSELKATKIIGQRKAFYRQRIPEFSCARKETVDIDILLSLYSDVAAAHRLTFSKQLDKLNAQVEIAVLKL